MKTDWQTFTIDDIKASKPNAISMGPFGSNIKSENFVPSGVPVIRGGNLNEGRFNDNNFVFLTDKKADQLRPANAFPNDLIFTHRGTLGQVGIIPTKAKYPRYVVSQSGMKLTCDEGKADPLYVFYFFRSQLGQLELLKHASQTGVPAIASPLTTLKAIKIPLPPLSAQRGIADVLGALDDKIECNRLINKTLEAMAQALYKHWFVDFGPFRGAGFVDSELGRIPQHYTIRRLGDFFPVLTGKRDANHGSPDGAYPFFTCAQTVSKISDYSFDGAAILLAGNGDFNVKWYRGKFDAYQRTYVLIPFEPEYLGLLFAAVKYNLGNITSAYQGSVIRFITKGMIENFRIACPNDKATIVSLSKKFDTMLSLIEANLIENATLTRTRDYLLPKLLSGEVEVKQLFDEIERLES